MQSYANFMHTVNLHSGCSLFVSNDMTAIRRQLIEIICVLWFVTFESWQGVVQFSDSIFSLHEEINSYYWPWCKPTGNTFQTNYSLSHWFACGVSFTIFPDYLVIYALIKCTGAFQSSVRTLVLLWLNMLETDKNWNDSLRAARKREVLSVKTCFVCLIFFPFSPWKAGVQLMNS